MSCFTWHTYKGTWKKNNDTLVFSYNYQVEEADTKVTYKKDSGKQFVIKFKTDKDSFLQNRNIFIEYLYDFEVHLGNKKKIVLLNEKNSIEISYKDIPNFDLLSSIRVEYFLTYREKRIVHLTENKIVNRKEKEIPNQIEVEFVEKPKKETVYRTITSVIQNNTLRIVSSDKTKIILHDYFKDIEFEDGYTLKK